MTRAHFGSLAFSAVLLLTIATARAAEVEVVSGDTFRVGDNSWRIANIDAPKLENTCADEARLGALAQAKLADVLAQGEMEIAPTGGVDMRQSKLALVRMNGEDVGEKMIAAGLAQRHGHARALCGSRNMRDLGNIMPGSTSATPQTPSSRHMN